MPDLVRGRQVVLDGELVALGPAGVPRFARLQQRMPARRPSTALLAAVPVQLYLFDVLHLDGEDTLDLPYTRRRQLLQDLGLDSVPVGPRLPSPTPGSTCSPRSRPPVWKAWCPSGWTPGTSRAGAAAPGSRPWCRTPPGR